MKRTALTIILFFSLFAAAYADKGLIPFTSSAKIFEPVQRAMIAWNGSEEILILTTDVHASVRTKSLEVIPLPSEPMVKKGDLEIFNRAAMLINRHLADSRLTGRRSGAQDSKSLQPSGEITFHQTIGTHEISVAHVLDSGGFIAWVDGYLRKSGVENPSIPPELKYKIEEYLKDKFNWFVFDVVSLEDSPRTNEAIQYRFATPSLFYPLKISGAAQGDTSISLTILTPRMLKEFHGIPIDRIELLHNPVTLTREEVQSLSPEIDELLGGEKEVKLRLWQIRGAFSSFDADLLGR
jgi:hypothetical protein